MTNKDQIIIRNNKLGLYTRSKNFLWTDSHIANNMLMGHLDVNNDAASRNTRTIKNTVQWINNEINETSSIIDFGCGPGLYTERLALLGHKVTGLDISENSIRYARESAQVNNLSIKYYNENYLNQIDHGVFDVALCIYCDFGALIPSEQKTFLKNVYNSLKENGVLIFDVFSEGLSETKKQQRDFTIVDTEDFWSAQPHFILSETVFFEEEIAWGQRNIIINQITGEQKEFTTWDTLYNNDRITELLQENGFVVEKIENGLVNENTFTSNDVLFIKARRTTFG